MILSKWPQCTSCLRFCLLMAIGPMTLNHFCLLKFFNFRRSTGIFVNHFFPLLYLWYSVYSVCCALLCYVPSSCSFRREKKNILHSIFASCFFGFLLPTTVQPFAHKNYFKIEKKRRENIWLILQKTSADPHSTLYRRKLIERRQKKETKKTSKFITLVEIFMRRTKQQEEGKNAQSIRNVITFSSFSVKVLILNVFSI